MKKKIIGYKEYTIATSVFEAEGFLFEKHKISFGKEGHRG